MTYRSERSLVWPCAIAPVKMGSFERLCIRMAERARAGGVPMRFLFLDHPAPAVQAELGDVGATWEILPRLGRLDGESAESLSQMLNGRGPVLAHFHYCSATSVVYPRLKLAGHLSVFTYHMSGDAQHARGLKKAVKDVRHAATTSFIDAFTAVSGWNRRKLAADYHIDESRIELIYNGVEVDSVPRRRHSGLVCKLIVVAALIPEKGIDVAIRALAHVRRRYPNSTLSIVGVGPEADALKDLARSERVEDAVSFLGLRDDVPKLMAEHDVVLVPSKWAEAFGLTLAEAMAAGCPVIASTVGGIPELVSHGANGLLASPGDEAAWADAILRLIEDSDLYRSLSRNAVVTAAERFDLRKNVARYWQLYRSLDPWTFSEF